MQKIRQKIGYARSIEKRVELIKASAKIQLVSLLLVFIGSYFIVDSNFALSTIVGSLCAVLPNMVFAYHMFKHQGAQAADKILTSFYTAGFFKFILVLVLLTVSFINSSRLPWLKPIGILSGFIIVFLSVLLLPIIANRIKK